MKCLSNPKPGHPTDRLFLHQENISHRVHALPVARILTRTPPRAEHFSIVDYVVIFEETNPYNLINAIKPHTLVKGGDYKDKEVVGQDIANELRLIKFIKGKSTTKTIKQIKYSG